MVKIKNANNPNKLQSEVKEIYKIHVVDKNLHEIKQEILVNYVGEFEMVGKSVIADQIREIHIRFRNNTEYEHHINAIDLGYDSEDKIFNRYIYENNTAQFNLVARSQYGNCCVFNYEFIGFRGNNCFIPSKRYCFGKSFNYLTGEGYTQQNQDNNRNKKTI